MPSQFHQAEVLAAAESLAVQTLDALSPDGCEHVRVLAGTTHRGPAFAYLCRRCADISVISIPAGGLRDRDPDDPTSRTRISTFPLSGVLCETGAYIESDGTVRATLALHVNGHPEPDWEITADDPAAVGRAVHAIRALRDTTR
ncbi:MAG TPA: hypothetical protein VFP72_18105 [Kineosporiaceae bacterium]|nr:hypothetical protein [Kineosporiaceae bacterium]